MKIKIFKELGYYKAVLMDGYRPIAVYWYEELSSVYELASQSSERYCTIVDVEYVMKGE